VRGEQRLFRLVKGHHRFDDEEVDSPRNQAANLFPECLARLFKGGLADRFEPDTKWAYGAADPRALRLLVGELVNRLPSHSRASLVYFEDTVLQAMSQQAKAVGPEGIRLDDRGAGLQILLMNISNDLRL
jgi:hypothetical protein